CRAAYYGPAGRESRHRLGRAKCCLAQRPPPACPVVWGTRLVASAGGSPGGESEVLATAAGQGHTAVTRATVPVLHAVCRRNVKCARNGAVPIAHPLPGPATGAGRIGRGGDRRGRAGAVVHRGRRAPGGYGGRRVGGRSAGGRGHRVR